MKTLFFILSFLSCPVMASQDRTDVPEVLMSHYFVASASQYPAIQTYGLASCIGVSLFDGVNGIGAIMHVAGMTDIPRALNIVISDMKTLGASTENIHAQLTGGWDDSMGSDGIGFASDQMLNSLKRELSKKHISFVEVSTLVTREQANAGASTSLNIELDLYSGQVYDFQQSADYVGGSISRPMPDNFQPYSL